MWTDGPPLKDYSAVRRDVLVLVARLDDATPREIAKELGRSHRAVRNALNGLHDDGLVQGQVGEEDRRQRTQSLTADGREILTAHAQWMVDSLERDAED